MDTHDIVRDSLYQQIEDNFIKISKSIKTFKTFEIAKLKARKDIDQYKYTHDVDI